MFLVERNLNPKAACLRRREEEKGDDLNGSTMSLNGPIGSATGMTNETSTIDGSHFMEQMHQSLPPQYWQQ